MPGSVRYLFSKKGKLKVSPQHIAWGAPAALPDNSEIVNLHSSIVNYYFAEAIRVSSGVIQFLPQPMRL
jgi:hypothetical protein